MAKKEQSKGNLVSFQPAEVKVQAPRNGVVGDFLTNTEIMFQTHTLRMKSLVTQINVTQDRMESLLEIAGEMLGAAETRLEEDLRRQGLLAPDPDEE
jgi:hypothetical protein